MFLGNVSAPSSFGYVNVRLTCCPETSVTYYPLTLRNVPSKASNTQQRKLEIWQINFKLQRLDFEFSVSAHSLGFLFYILLPLSSQTSCFMSLSSPFSSVMIQFVHEGRFYEFVTWSLIFRLSYPPDHVACSLPHCNTDYTTQGTLRGRLQNRRVHYSRSRYWQPC